MNFIFYGKIFFIFGSLRLFMMTTNLFVIVNVKQLRTDGSFRILLPFFRISWGVGPLNSAIFNSFHNRVEFGTILQGLLNFGGFETPNPPPPRYATDSDDWNLRLWGAFCGACELLAPLKQFQQLISLTQNKTLRTLFVLYYQPS